MSWRKKRFTMFRKVLHISSCCKKHRLKICDSPRSGKRCSSTLVVRNIITTCRRYQVQHIAVPSFLFEEYRLRMHDLLYAAKCFIILLVQAIVVGEKAMHQMQQMFYLSACYDKQHLDTHNLQNAGKCCSFLVAVGTLS